jgi:hypothetical protein
MWQVAQHLKDIIDKRVREVFQAKKGDIIEPRHNLASIRGHFRDGDYGACCRRLPTSHRIIG